jgi:membrane protein
MKLPATLKIPMEIARDTIAEFLEDDCFRMAAALAYYTIFSMPPLLAIVITVAGVVWEQEAAEGRVKQEMRSLIGEEGAEQVQVMLQNARERVQGQNWATVLGVGAFVFGATGAFVQLQRALNTAWGVQPDPKRGGVRNFIFKRLLSFGMILAIAFLLLVALLVSAMLNVFGGQIDALFSERVSTAVLRALDFLVSLAVITVLFAAMFKVLPDAEVAWRDVWVGAVATSLLFVLGKFLIGLYLGQARVGSAYGAAGSLAIVLIWIYFAGLILFLGAEFTQVWARRYGTKIVPVKGAVKVVEEIKHVRGDKEEVAEEHRKD